MMKATKNDTPSIPFVGFGIGFERIERSNTIKKNNNKYYVRARRWYLRRKEVHEASHVECVSHDAQAQKAAAGILAVVPAMLA